MSFLPFVLGFLTYYIFFIIPEFGLNLSYLPGDLGDTRLNNYFLEHGFKFIIGDVKEYWNAPFMYPEKAVITYSDNLLGLLPIYSLFRLLSFDIHSALSGLLLVVFILNYTSVYLLLKAFLKSEMASSLGALFFCCALCLQTQTTHVQTYARFPMVFSIWFAIEFIKSANLKYFVLSMVAFVYQFYCSFYLGFILFYALLFLYFLGFLYFVKVNFLKLKPIWFLKIIIIVILSFLILLPLASPYIERAKEMEEYSFLYVYQSLPTLSCYLFSYEGSLFWDVLSKVNINFLNYWDLMLFPGGFALVAYIFFFYYTFYAFIKNKTGDHLVNLLILLLSLWIITTIARYGMNSPYRFIQNLPGFSSMRSLGRIINLNVIFFAFGVAYFSNYILNKNWLKKPIIYIVLLSLIVLDNFVLPNRINRFDINISRERIDILTKKIEKFPDNSIVCLLVENPGKDPAYYELDMMFAAQRKNMKTINAYTATGPSDYSVFWYNMNQDGLDQWIKSRNIRQKVFVIREQSNSYLNIKSY